MLLISKIEIRYFRSVYTVTLNPCRDINILMGGNDAGKSNVLKALNLFFNNETDLGIPYLRETFTEDITKFRLVEAADAGGRATIWIKITFKNYFKWSSLPDEFEIKKTWNRYSDLPERTWSPQKYNGKNILEQTISKFLNKISFHYIPAVKGRHIFSYYLGKVYDALLDDVKVGLTNSTAGLAEDVERAVTEMSEKIKDHLGFDSTIKVPNDFRSLFESLDFSTKHGGFDIPLQHRGDGVQARHIPFILEFIATKSKKHHIWAYEEPENSLEMSKAFDLAEQFQDTFSKENQIFLTTHSPAFYSFEDKKSSKWFVKSTPHNGNDNQKITTISKIEGFSVPDEHLGVADLVKDRAKEAYQTIKQQQNLLDNLQSQIAGYTKPTLITEGKSDALILQEAWKKLYPDEDLPFEIASCSPTEDENSAGVVALCKYMDSVLHSEVNIKIGIFDRDEEGVNGFTNKLSSHLFKKPADKDIKSHQNGKAHAILLPKVVDATKEYWEKDQPCIEFLFSKEDFPLKYVEEKYMFNGSELTQEQAQKIKNDDLFSNQVTYRVKPKGNFKKHFSEKKVPTLPVEAFKNFKPLFDDIRLLLNPDQQQE